MFRLIKLAMYAMVGYVLYEFYQGMTQHQQQHGGRSFGGGGAGGFGEDTSRSGALTGEGVGMIETALDADGGEMPHRVGRGVIRSGSTI